MKLLFFLFLSIQLQSQNVFKGKVINSKGEEIVGANIISNLSDKIYISDYTGSFYIYTDQPIFSIKILIDLSMSFLNLSKLYFIFDSKIRL